jgi:hypothetical protein
MNAPDFASVAQAFRDADAAEKAVRDERAAIVKRCMNDARREAWGLVFRIEELPQLHPAEMIVLIAALSEKLKTSAELHRIGESIAEELEGWIVTLDDAMAADEAEAAAEDK